MLEIERHDERLTLANEFMEVAFEAELGRWISLKNRRTGREFVQHPEEGGNWCLLLPLPGKRGNYLEGEETPLEQVQIRRRGKWVEVRFLWKEVRKGSKVFPVRLSSIVTLHEDSPQVLFQIALKNMGWEEIPEVWYPLLSGVAFKRHRFHLVIPDQEGRVEEDFFPGLPGRIGTDFSYGRLGQCFRYPIPLVMQWVSLTNGREGLYIGSHDESFSPKEFRFERYAEERAHISVNHHPYLKRGKEWVSGFVVVAPFVGGYHAAARIYRDWAKTSLAPPPKPAWFRNWQGWGHTILHTSEGRVYWNFSDLPSPLAPAVRRVGLDTLGICGFHQGGMGGNYPHYWPAQVLGGKEAFREAIRKCHRLGVKVICFAKTANVDPSTEEYQRHYHQWTAKTREGVSYFSYWGYGTTEAYIWHVLGTYAQMCPYPQEWQRLITEIMSKNIAGNGADGVQLDEVLLYFFCFDPSHGHSNPATAFNEGYRELLSRLKRACRKRNPRFVVLGEEPADNLIQYLDGAFSRYLGESMPQLWRFVYPWFPRTFTVSEGQWDRMYRAWMWGMPFDLRTRSWRGSVEELGEAMIEEMHELVRIRKQLGRWMLRGDFLDTLGASVEPHIPYCVYKARGGWVVALYNNHSKERKVRVELEEFQKPFTYTLFKPHEREEVGKERGGVSLTLPGRGVAAMLFQDPTSKAQP